MKKYLVNVNGEDYEITLQVLDQVGSMPQTAQPTPAPVAPQKAAPTSNAGSQKVTAPMPGTILSIQVKPGQPVKKGDVLMILEAMKMENEIMAPADGTVVSVNANQGTSVETGTLLCTIN